MKLNTKETTIYNSLVKKKPIFYYNLLILEEQLTLEEIEEIKKSKKKLLNKQKKVNKKKTKINSNEKQTHIFLLINNSEDKFAIIDLHSKYETLDIVIFKKSFQDRFIKIFQDIFKYGLNNFTFKFLKTISLKELKSTKEELINIYKKTYKNTYNVKSRKEYKRNFDINEIIQYYNSSDNITLQKLSNKFSLSTKFLSKLLKENNVEIKKVKNNKPIYQLDTINLEIIQCFESLSKAIKENEKWKSTTIHDVLKGKNKTAYGFKWCYVEDYKFIK